MSEAEESEESESEIEFQSDLDAQVEKRTRYRCRGCKYVADAPWFGACPACYLPFNIEKSRRRLPGEGKLRGTLADDVPDLQYNPIGIAEMDRVLGGGLVYGHVVLLGGKRGKGKTRLCLRVADSFARADRRAYFITGENDKLKTQQFAKQLGIKNQYVDVLGDPAGITIDTLPDELRGRHIKLVVLDSVQSLAYSDRKADFGDPAQVKTVCNYITSLAKTMNLAVLMIGQLTGAGLYAGGEALQHGVDVLLRLDPYELLEENERSKNFGEPLSGSEGLLRLWIDEKSRQSSPNLESFLVMTDEGKILPPPPHVLRHLSKIELVR